VRGDVSRNSLFSDFDPPVCRALLEIETRDVLIFSAVFPMSGDVLRLLSGHGSCPLLFPLSISLCRSFFDRQVVLPCRRLARVQVVDCTGSRNVRKGIQRIHRNVQRSSPVCTCMSDTCPMKVGPWKGCSLGSLL